MELKMTDDEKQYIALAEKGRRTSGALTGILLCLVILIYLVTSGIPASASMSDRIVALLVCGIFVLFGLKILWTSFRPAVPGDPEILEGIFKSRLKRRHHFYFIDKTNVTLPPGWHEFLKPGESCRCTVSRVQKTTYVLRIDPLPSAMTGKTLVGLYEEGKRLAKAASRTVLRFFLILALIGAVIYGLFKGFFMFAGDDTLKSIGQFVVDNPGFIEGLFKFLNHGGGMVLLVLIIGAVMFFAAVKGISGPTKKMTEEEAQRLEPQSWLQEYSAFFRTDGMSLMQPSKDVEKIANSRQTIERWNLFKAEYKALCRNLSGEDRRRFISEFKELRTQLMREARGQ